MQGGCKADIKKKKGKKPVFFKTDLPTANKVKLMCRTERNTEQWGQNKERSLGQDAEGQPGAPTTEEERVVRRETTEAAGRGPTHVSP